MKRNLLILAVFALFCVGASSCKHLPIDPVDPVDSTSIHHLTGTSWQLTGISANNERMQTPLNEIFTLKFDDKNHIGGQAACNSYGGDVKADGKNISFSNIVATQVYCGDLSLDREYFAALNSAKTYTQSGTESLTIFTNSGTTLYFQNAHSTHPPDFSGVVHFADFRLVDFHIDPFQILNIKKIDATHVQIAVQYGGGCEEHEFNLFADENIQPGNATDFVQMMITHDAHGDMCKALITKEYTFDVSPLLKKWQGNPNTNRSLTLQFSQSNIGTVIYTK